ncbi:sulfurtransferase-like selenium metabolism protein YedF [Fusobacterium sp. PH5-44]|uniref:sulfurtransferase-like selenium metabolism protein YedF n=1 Tax=unclassified Fusobacterium TaxID=2648384 RepID=UPI003D222BFA
MRKTVDSRGEQCPIPVIRAKQELKNLNHGDSLCVLIDNEISMQNLVKMANQLNIEVKNQKTNDGYSVEFFCTGERIKITEIKKEDYGDVSIYQSMTFLEKYKKKQIVIVIGSDKYGKGDDTLGQILMKGFVYATGALEDLPKTIIFLNSGINITCKGSDSLEDLKEMESKGVEIISCGTCLDYYNKKEELMVGNISNMYTIVEKQMFADLVINL